MRAFNNSSLVAITLCWLGLGCSPNDPITITDSGLAAVEINAPTIDSFRAVYGAQCEMVRLPAETLAQLSPATGCDAIVKLLDQFRLNIEPSSPGGTKVSDQIGSLANSNINETLIEGYNYSVKLELGLFNGQYLLSNDLSFRNNLPNDRLGQDSVNLSVHLSPTAAGIAQGFPAGQAPNNSAGSQTIPPSGPSGSQSELGDIDGLTEEELKTAKLINDYRASRGLSFLTLNKTLTQYAIENSRRQSAARVSGHYTNFNVAEIAFYGPTTAERAVQGWKESKKGHNELMQVPRWKHFGVSAGESGNSWTVTFN